MPGDDQAGHDGDGHDARAGAENDTDDDNPDANAHRGRDGHDDQDGAGDDHGSHHGASEAEVENPDRSSAAIALSDGADEFAWRDAFSRGTDQASADDGAQPAMSRASDDAGEREETGLHCDAPDVALANAAVEIIMGHWLM